MNLSFSKIYIVKTKILKSHSFRDVSYKVFPQNIIGKKNTNKMLFLISVSS